MGLIKRYLNAGKTPALTAAAATPKLTEAGWRLYPMGQPQGQQRWQVDAWHYYDNTGELSFAGNWSGEACSRSRIFVAELDEDGRPGEETKDAKIQAIGQAPFGGPSGRAEAQRVAGIGLFVAGELWIVGESGEPDDLWYLCATDQVRPLGSAYEVLRPVEHGGDWHELDPESSILIRCWTPHPRRYDLAHSSVRAALRPLRGLERLSMYEFAIMDSRLASNGMLVIPNEVDFPRGDDSGPADASSLARELTQTAATAMADRESPAAVVPMVVQAPGDQIKNIQHLTFDTDLNEKLGELREAYVASVSRALSMDPEILLGKGGMNHWGAFQVESSTLQMHIAPLLLRWCDALTKGWLHPALTKAGLDPSKYVYWYDMSPLTVQPDRQGDALELFREGIISGQEVRDTGNFSDDAAPKAAERAARIALKLIEVDPNMIFQEPVRKALGLKWDGLKEPLPPAPAGGPAPSGGAAGRRPNPGSAPRTPQSAALAAGAHEVVLRGLELAGKRLLTREHRTTHAETDPWALHTVITVDRERVWELANLTRDPLAVAQFAEVDPSQLGGLLRAYVAELLMRGEAHRPDLLTLTLSRGLHAACERTCALPHLPPCPKTAAIEAP